MEEKFIINGMNQLSGELRIKGAKNAVLPIMAAAILTEEEVVIRNCSSLRDVDNMCKILEHVGCQVQHQDDALIICSQDAHRVDLPETLCRELRSSIFLLGPLLGRFHKAMFTHPGGCEIGLRPIDLHIRGLKRLGAAISEEYGVIDCSAQTLTGAEIYLDYPSVGATENIMMAAVKAQGYCTIHNAAREPEIICLMDFINAMGGKVRGAGTDVITVEGVDHLHGTEFRLIPDRIVAGTYMIAAAITRGDVIIRDLYPQHILALTEKLQEMGCPMDINKDSIHVHSHNGMRAIGRVETQPYPGFATDLQSQYFVAAALSKGTTMLVENVFENRFRYVAELYRMGAQTFIEDRTAVINGIDHFMGANVKSTDLRGGAALVLAGLWAEGQTVVHEISHIIRGYENIHMDLASLGADIKKV